VKSIKKKKKKRLKMSQQRQQERPNADQQESINYGDIFLEVQENLTNPISQVYSQFYCHP